jgi:hypothetical protein
MIEISATDEIHTRWWWSWSKIFGHSMKIIVRNCMIHWMFGRNSRLSDPTFTLSLGSIFGWNPVEDRVNAVCPVAVKWIYARYRNGYELLITDAISDESEGPPWSILVDVEHVICRFLFGESQRNE